MQHRWIPLRTCLMLTLLGCGLLLGRSVAQGDESPDDAVAVPMDQLEVNKAALQAGSVSAARLMLASRDPLTREELLTIVADPAQVQAHAAVCSALNSIRMEGLQIWRQRDLVGPLLMLLSDPNSPSSVHVPEALLVYDYQEIKEPLEAMAKDTELPVAVRLNALRALRIQPYKEAILTILTLTGDPAEAVAAQAREILDGFGIDAGARDQVVNELNAKDMDEYLWKWLIRQESRVRDLREARNYWQGLTLKTLDDLYKAYTDDGDRGVLLVENLQSPQSSRKIWALEKVRDWRVALRRTSSPLPPELTPVLAALLSDPSDEVRFEVADLLALFPQVEYVDLLLRRLDVEPLQATKLKLFVALGFSLQVDLQLTLPIHVRQEALKWASKFLNQEDSEAVRQGATVICQLLESNGLDPEDAEQALEQLVYRMEQLSPDSPLKEHILKQMVYLCGERSRARSWAINICRPIFVEALQDPTVTVREQGMEGLISIDPAAALERFKAEVLPDPEARIRAKVYVLAASRGRAEDLEWLIQQASSNENDDQAVIAGAIATILTQAEWMVIRDGITPLIHDPNHLGLSDDQWLSILQHAYRMAGAEGDRVSRSIYGAELLSLYLSKGQTELAVSLLVGALGEGDLDPKGGYAVTLGRFFSDPDRHVIGLALADAVSAQLDPGIERPHWQRWVQSVNPEIGEQGQGQTPPVAEDVNSPIPGQG